MRPSEFEDPSPWHRNGKIFLSVVCTLSLQYDVFALSDFGMTESYCHLDTLGENSTTPNPYVDKPEVQGLMLYANNRKDSLPVQPFVAD
jgi:hypothetical protein